MAIVTAGLGSALDFRLLDVIGLLDGDVADATASRVVVSYGGGDRDEFTGSGFAYNSFGEPVGGTITGYRSYVANVLTAEVTGASASVEGFMAFVKQADTAGAVFFILSGDDQVSGSALADYMAGGAGADTLAGFGGDDSLIGNSGNDVIDGGNGLDTAVFSGARSQYTIASGVAGWTVIDNRTASSDGADTVKSVEYLQFSDSKVALTGSVVVEAAINTGLANILRADGAQSASAAVAADVSARLAAGALTASQAIGELVKAADATTSVATLAYQFFTGKMPGSAGIDYLVSPTGPNPNNLNSAYYQSFNLENRYINFAVNLGREGEGKAQFQAEYGGLTLAQATKLAYDEIFGTAPSDAKVAALLSGGRDLYFQAYGQDGPNGLGTKAAMVGWLLAEAEKADLGQYARANAAFLTDLADGASFAVDLIGTYGKAEYDLTA